MSNIPIPSSRAFITSLFTSIAIHCTTDQHETANPLKNAPSSLKPLLLTLHVLFPNEFLPALDVLDRKLITRFSIKAYDDDEGHEPKHGTFYFVRSAQQPSLHGGHARFANPLTTHYEVRPRAWNCSCPSLAFSAFPGEPDGATAIATTASTTQLSDEDWSFGGLSLGDAAVPVCKHLLACVLLEQCPGLFGSALEERTVTKDEWAGWCAGWGG